MIFSRHFAQLLPDPLAEIRAEYGYCTRKEMPTGFGALLRCGIPEGHVKRLQELSDGTYMSRARIVAAFLLCVFEGEPLSCRAGYERWLREKGGLSAVELSVVRDVAADLRRRSEMPSPSGAPRLGRVSCNQLCAPNRAA